MATIPIKQPRRIDPSLVEIGDDISVTFKKDRGLTTTNRGIVGKRMDSGSTRYLLTEEGATLLAWEPSRTKLVEVTLYGREEVPQSTLFDIAEGIDLVKQRIA
jgi:hypothetical protein